MATNRKQPFGYRIVCGEIVPHESEAATVQWIFATYLAGASYSTLVGALQERGVPYDTGKPWNKNKKIFWERYAKCFVFPSKKRARSACGILKSR